MSQEGFEEQRSYRTGFDEGLEKGTRKGLEAIVHKIIGLVHEDISKYAFYEAGRKAGGKIKDESDHYKKLESEFSTTYEFENREEGK